MSPEKDSQILGLMDIFHKSNEICGYIGARFRSCYTGKDLSVTEIARSPMCCWWRKSCKIGGSRWYTVGKSSLRLPFLFSRAFLHSWGNSATLCLPMQPTSYTVVGIYFDTRCQLMTPEEVVPFFVILPNKSDVSHNSTIKEMWDLVSEMVTVDSDAWS